MAIRLVLSRGSKLSVDVPIPRGPNERDEIRENMDRCNTIFRFLLAKHRSRPLRMLEQNGLNNA